MEKIKKASVDTDIKFAEAKEALTQDVSSYMQERDKTNRGTDGLLEDALKTSQAEFEVKKILYDNSIKDVELPENVEPMFNEVFLTARRNKLIGENGLWTSNSVGTEGLESDYQKVQLVMAVGPQVQQLKKGMEVVVRFEDFRKMLSGSMAQKVNKESELNIPILTINDTDYIKVSERNIEYISNNKL